MKVLIVSTWQEPCGIAEHTEMLTEAVHVADPAIQFCVSKELLDPSVNWPFAPRVLHLNYQDAIHSRWQPDTIQRAKSLGCKVLVTLHDSGTPNGEHAKQICAAADYFVVHEPFDDLPGNGEYLRMGVPAWAGSYEIDRDPRAWSNGRPVLGTVGVNLGFKCYDKLAEVTAACGWAFRLIAPGANAEDVKRWSGINPHMLIDTTFLPRRNVLQILGGCDATAFTYVCHNTGQSGAILQGIAARKPVIALRTCRMFRSLYEDPLGAEAIRWAETFDDVAWHLRHMNVERVETAIVALAEQESWSRVGQRYAAIYREMVR